MIVIRLIKTPDEAIRCIDLAQQMHAELGEKTPFDRATTLENMGRIIGSDHHPMALWGAFGDNDELMGAFLGALHPFFFSHAKFAQHIIWYVKPERRGTGAARLLFDAFEMWAREHGAVELHLAMGRLDEQLQRMARKLGAELQGHFYVMELRDAAQR